MQRRTVLRRSAGVLALSVPLAGCSGGSNDTEDGNGEDGDDGDDGGTPTPSGPGEVVENTVDGLEIVGMEVVESDDERYTVVLTVRNTGDQETDAFDYEYGLTVFDAEGNDVTAGVSGTSATGATIAPGEEAEIRATTGFEGEKSDIESFEVTVGCDDFGDTGVYCRDSSN
jgi:hypothetical protein